MEDNQSFLDLQVDPEVSHSMTEATRWGKFLAVGVLIAFVLCVSLVAFLWSAFSEGFERGFRQSSSNDSATALVLVLVVMAIVFVVIAIMFGFLIKAFNRIRKGVQNRDQFTFNSGLANLKNYFTMYAALSVLGLLVNIINFFAKN
jgi:hypothetical protein